MRRIGVLAALSTGLFVMAEAHALQIRNLETLPQEVVIIEGDVHNRLVIMPGEAVDGLCSTDCVLQLQSGEEYQVRPEDKVVLEGGDLLLDDQEQGSSPEIENGPALEGNVTSQ